MKRPVALFLLGAMLFVVLYMLGLVVLGQHTMAVTLTQLAELHIADLGTRVNRTEATIEYQAAQFAAWIQQSPAIATPLTLDIDPTGNQPDFIDFFSQLRVMAVIDPAGQAQYFYHEGESTAPELEQTLRAAWAQMPSPQNWGGSYWIVQPFQVGDEYWAGILASYPESQDQSGAVVAGIFSLDTLLGTFDIADGVSLQSLWILGDQGEILFQSPVDDTYSPPEGFGETQVAPALFADFSARPVGWMPSSETPGDIFAWHTIALGDSSVQTVELLSFTRQQSAVVALWLPFVLVGVVLALGLIVTGIGLYIHTQRLLTQELNLRTQELQQALTRYGTLFEHSPDLIFLVDPFGQDSVWRLEECNPQVSRMLGYDAGELVGLDVDSLFVNPIKLKDREWYLAELRAQRTLRFESILRHKDGTPIPLELSSVFLEDQGRTLLLIIGRDVQSLTQIQTLEDDYDQMVLALNQVAIDVTSSLSVDTILFRLVEATHTLFPESFAATVQLLNEAGDEMVTAYASEGALETPRKVVFRPGVGVAGLAIAQQKVVNVGNVHEDPRFVPGAVPPPFVSLLVAPMAASSRVWGTLSIEGKDADVFSRRDERMANMLARQAGVALENAYLYRIAQQERELAETLREIGMVLTGALRQEDVLRHVIEQVERVLHYSAASIYLAEPDGSYYRFVGVGYEKFYLPNSDRRQVWTTDQNPAMRKVGTTGEVVILSDVATDPAWLQVPDYDWVGSWAGAPIQVRGEVIGVFCLDHEEPGYYGAQHKYVLEGLAAQVSVAIENALLFEQVQNYALNLQAEVAQQTEEIRAQQERTDAILRSIDDAVITFDPSGVIMFANEASCRLVGHDIETLIGSSVGGYFHRNTSRALVQAMASAIRQREVWRGDVYLQHFNGYPILIDAVAVPYLGQDATTIGYIASMRPLSDEQVTERMKAQFMTLISHELRTPLTNMKLHLHLLRKTADDPAATDRYLDALEGQIGRLAEMMEKVLTVIRLTDSESLVYDDLINLETLMDSLMVRFRTPAEEKAITLSIEPMNAVARSAIMQGDGQWVTQACYELIENALTYTPEQGTITVRVNEFQQNARRFLGIAVHDTGPGIEPQELDRLNATFTRVGEQRSGEFPGIGLGLFIAHTVGEQLGGGLLVESEPGKGSVFTLYLPVMSQDE